MTIDAHTIIDHRGYLFRFPTLGLPDPDPNDIHGQDVLIRAAIGTREAIPLLTNEAAKAPRRYAAAVDGYDPIDLEYDGAVWVLPFLVPEKASTEAEVFTLRVRRLHPLAVPNPGRIKLPEERPLLHLQPPASIFPHQTAKGAAKLPTERAVATESDEDNFWKGDFMTHLDAESRLRRRKPFHPGTFTIFTFPAKAQNTSEVMAEDGVDPHGALSENWEKGVKALAFIERVKATGFLPRQDPDLWLSGASVMGVVQTTYAIHWDEDGPQPRQEQWKVVPWQAYKPGCELPVKNAIRKRMGLKSLSQEELERTRPGRH